MSSPDDLLVIIQAYCQRYRNGTIGFNQLVAYIDRFLLENPDKERLYEDVARGNGRTLIQHLEQLAANGLIKILRNNEQISSLIVLSYFLKIVEDNYQRLDDKPELAFPTEDSLQMIIPPEEVRVVDIKADLVQWLTREPTGTLLRIAFPDGVQSLLTTDRILNSRMVLAAVQKIRHYLRDTKNSSYMRQKLTPLFRSKEIVVKEMMHTISSSPESATQSILEPTDFSYQLWNQLSINIIKEYAPKPDKLAEEHGFCQAAYLIGYFILFHRGKVQRKKEEEASLGYLAQNLRKAPYAYRLTQIFEFTDDKGILLLRRCSKEKITDYLEEKTKAAPGKDFPEILRFATHDHQDYYIMYSSVAQYLSDNLLRAQRDMREFYKSSWQLALRGGVEFITMHTDEAFRSHVQQRLRRHFPQLEAVLVFPIVYFASRVDGLPVQARMDINDLMLPAAQRLKSVEQMMKLARKKMLDDAKILLPAWMVIPGLRSVVGFFRRLFLGKELAARSFSNGFDHEGQERYVRTSRKDRPIAEEKPAGKDNGSEEVKAGSRNQQAIFRQASRLLESSFLPDGEALEPTMSNLLDRWNTLIDPKTKSDLTTDVNTLCRDYLRKQKAFGKSSPPSAETLKIYAGKLVDGEHLTAIRNKKDLRRYIELYFVWLLENI